MARAVDRALKLTLMVVVGIGVVATTMTGHAVLGDVLSAFCVIGGSAAFGWMVIRAIREGGFNVGMLKTLSRLDRRLVRRSWRQLEAVPLRLMPTAQKYAYQRGLSNDRTGWFLVGLILFDAQPHTPLRGTPDLFRLATIVTIICLGLFSDLAGVIWLRASEALKKRHSEILH